MFVAIKQFGGKDRLFAANRQNKWNKKRERRFSDTFSKVIPIIFPESFHFIVIPTSEQLATPKHFQEIEDIKNLDIAVSAR